MTMREEEAIPFWENGLYYTTERERLEVTIGKRNLEFAEYFTKKYPDLHPMEKRHPDYIPDEQQQQPHPPYNPDEQQAKPHP